MNLAATLLLAAAEAAAQSERASAAKLASPEAVAPRVAAEPRVVVERHVAATSEPARAAAPSVRRIVVSIPDRKLALVEDGRVVKVYRVAVGADVTPSPPGALTIVHRVTSPAYYHPGKSSLRGRQIPWARGGSG